MRRATAAVVSWLLMCPLVHGGGTAEAVAESPSVGAAAPGAAPAISEGVDESNSPLRPYIERFTRDRMLLGQYYSIRLAEDRREQFEKFYQEWESRLEAMNFNALNEDGQIDYVLFHHSLEHALKQLAFEAKLESEAASYVPVADTIIGLEEARRNGLPVDSQKSAATLAQLKLDLEKLQKEQQKNAPKDATTAAQSTRINANRAADEIEVLRQTLRHWYTFYDNYDPVFTWWNSETYKKADDALREYGRFLREKLAGVRGAGAEAREATTANAGPRGGGRGGDEEVSGNLRAAQGAKAGDTSDIIGNPIGRDELMAELQYEMIPYTPEELIDVAEREFKWCEDQMKQASREMGMGDDWKKALEKVKNMYVAPGKQPQLIWDLAHEAEDFIDSHQLVTVPPLAKSTWRMQMMTPERQLINPFFTGGDTISISYPTEEMTYEQKMMSMRGNNIPFSRATVFHELIPGHELQLFMADRFHAYRRALGSTPFTVEGWALYWELILWDMKFQKTPEDRIGALFWRMHRCARIIFSLSYHLGKMTPEECVNFLVDRVGHERENAIAEVRRSVAGDYGPLYQAAYLLGGMQLYSLHSALVGSGKMTNQQFNDAVLKQNMMPIELIRAAMIKQKLTRDYQTTWKFLDSGSIPGVR